MCLVFVSRFEGSNTIAGGKSVTAHHRSTRTQEKSSANCPRQGDHLYVSLMKSLFDMDHFFKVTMHAVCFLVRTVQFDGQSWESLDVDAHLVTLITMRAFHLRFWSRLQVFFEGVAHTRIRLTMGLREQKTIFLTACSSELCL